ncbi:hypothetical protein NST86_32115 [Bacillus sp. FSL L8-0199]|uniref:hypothetical protein n=1 Tax=Bacillus TaxID=1386 RepID=UPI0020CBF863|nr:hypothetical protein [Bacillus thuringiensis]
MEIINVLSWHTLNTAGTVASWILVAMLTILSLLSNRVPIVAVLAPLAAVELIAMQVVLHRVTELSFRVARRNDNSERMRMQSN